MFVAAVSYGLLSKIISFSLYDPIKAVGLQIPTELLLVFCIFPVFYEQELGMPPNSLVLGDTTTQSQ